MTSTVTTSPGGAAGADSRRPTGPHLGALGLISLGLTLASLATAALLSDGRAYVSPFASTTQILGYYHHQWAARVSTMLLFGSAVPLGIFAATAYTRLRRLGVLVPGPSIGFFGGIAASLMLMISAMTGWVLGRPEIASSPAVLHALSFLSFLSGGVAFVTGLGLLIAGIAVPVLVLRLAPRWCGWAGLVIAVLSELTFLGMVIQPIQLLLPIGRYAGLLWLIAVGFLLPTRRPVAGEDRR